MAIPTPSSGARRVSRPGQTEATRRRAPSAPAPVYQDPVDSLFSGLIMDSGQAAGPDYSLVDMQYQAQAQQIAQQAQIEAQQRMLERQLQLAGLGSDITGLEGQFATSQNMVPAQVGDVEAIQRYRTGQAEQQGLLDRAGLVNQMTERGLGQSGIRLGAESRHSADILDQVAGIGLESTQDINRIRADAAAQQAGIRSQLARARAQRDVLSRFGRL